MTGEPQFNDRDFGVRELLFALRSPIAIYQELSYDNHQARPSKSQRKR